MQILGETSMARKRMIDPNMWGDPDFSTLSIKARILFIGLISNADDEGYLQGNAGSIKRLVFGFDRITADATQLLINEIAERLHSVHIYQADGQTYIHLANWFKYQKQQKDRILPSLFPKCSKCVAGDIQVITEVKLSKDSISKEKLNNGDARPEKTQESSKGMSSLKDILVSKGIPIAQEKKTGISTPWQEKALRWADDLGVTLGQADKSRWFKVFKDAANGRKSDNLERAYSFLKDSPTFPGLSADGKLRYFFSIYENGVPIPITT